MTKGLAWEQEISGASTPSLTNCTKISLLMKRQGSILKVAPGSIDRCRQLTLRPSSSDQTVGRELGHIFELLTLASFGPEKKGRKKTDYEGPALQSLSLGKLILWNHPIIYLSQLYLQLIPKDSIIWQRSIPFYAHN